MAGGKAGAICAQVIDSGSLVSPPLWSTLAVLSRRPSLQKAQRGRGQNLRHTASTAGGLLVVPLMLFEEASAVSFPRF